MDPSKKRKADENGGVYPPLDAPAPLLLTPQDARKILSPLSADQLLDILQNAVVRDPTTLDEVRAVADADVTRRKLFVRGLGWETTTATLHAAFAPSGEIAEAVVIADKSTGKSKGYGFVIFKHIDGAVLALKEPNKKIDGRITVAQLASQGNSGNISGNSNNPGGHVDVSMRKIYVGNIPFEISSERLLGHFLAYGEIEEGPLGFDKMMGKAKGFAFFVYKTEEGARASLVDPIKTIDGHQVVCKLATDGKKGKPNNVGQIGAQGTIGDVVGPPGSNYGPVPPYGGGPGGYNPQMPLHQNPHGSALAPAIGGVGFGNQGGAGFGNQGVNAFGGYGGGGYGSQYGGSGTGEYGGLNRMPPSTGGMGAGVYAEGGNYGLSSGYPAQVNQPPAGPRFPPGGMYQGGPPYY